LFTLISWNLFNIKESKKSKWNGVVALVNRHAD